MEELISGYTEEIENTELYSEYLEEEETLEKNLDRIKEEEREKFKRRVKQKRARQRKEKAFREKYMKVEQFDAIYTDSDRKVLDFDFEDGKIVFNEPVNEQEGDCPVNRGDIWVGDVDHERAHRGQG